MKSHKITQRDPRFAPAWPRTPWPGEPRFREAMMDEALEPLARRIDAIWGLGELEDAERHKLLQVVRFFKIIDRRPRWPDKCTDVPDEKLYREAEDLVAALERRYGVTDEDEGHDLI